MNFPDETRSFDKGKVEITTLLTESQLEEDTLNQDGVGRNV